MQLCSITNNSPSSPFQFDQGTIYQAWRMYIVHVGWHLSLIMAFTNPEIWARLPSSKEEKSIEAEGWGTQVVQCAPLFSESHLLSSDEFWPQVVVVRCSTRGGYEPTKYALFWEVDAAGVDSPDPGRQVDHSPLHDLIDPLAQLADCDAENFNGA